MENDRKTIFFVDDNMTNLTVGKDITKDKYRTFPLPSAGTMFDLLEQVEPDLILLDIEMSEMNGYEAIRRLKENARWAQIPVIFLTSKSDEGSELEGLSLGAIDYVAKPFSAPLLLKRIENHLSAEAQKKELKNVNENLTEIVKQKTIQLSSLHNAILNTVADLVESRDSATGGHINRTQKYMELLSNGMISRGIYRDETSTWDLESVVSSAQLHDTGKISISDAILNKPGKLSPEEFEIMKTHVPAGVQAIRRIEKTTGERSFLKHARLIAGSHHEKWDGSGYPAGISGKDIPLEGRLMAIADVYDALVSARPYKRPMSTDEARKIILEGKGTHFDPALVEMFSELADEFARVAKEESY
ncbi:response regulator [Spirochaetia bacterium]|nr:response regulator [Spirochaetia bacterium]